MIIRTLLAGILSVIACYLTMRHNIHMFQLNGYKNSEHIIWIKRNLRQQWLLLFGLFLGVLRLLYYTTVIDVFIYITLLVDIIVYRAMKRMNTKKGLVYTSRVKRLIACILLITLLPMVLTILLLGREGIKYINALCIIGTSAQLFINMLANIIVRPLEIGINNYYINDAKKKLRDNKGIKVIGITGSYGKTSVKYYLKTLLQEKYNVLVTPGNYNTTLGVTKTIREYLEPTHQIFLCEMGARHVGDIKEICDLVHPDYGIITSIGPQHLDTFHNLENIKRTKFELADSLPKTGLIFLNGDNKYIQEMADSYSSKVFYFSQKQGDGYQATDIKVSQLGTEFTIVSPNKESERFQMKLIGSHNVINVAGAIAVANTFGIPLNKLKVPVRRLQPVEHRMQIREHGIVTIIDDAYNSNPIGSKAAVETLAMFDGLRILITPGMVELGKKEEEYNYQFGINASNCCDYILLVGKRNSRPIMDGALSKGFDAEKCLIFNNLEDALSYAYTIKTQKHKYILLENDLPDNY